MNSFEINYTGGGDCNTGQFFGPSGVIAVISSFFPIFYVPGVIAVILRKTRKQLKTRTRGILK